MASTQVESEQDSPKGGDFLLETSLDAVLAAESNQKLHSSEVESNDSSLEYVQLQLRVFRATLILSFLAALVTGIVFGFFPSISLLVGSLSGILYLRLLARSIGKLGKSSKAVGKIQLLVPVLLVLAVSKLPQLELIPALLGFLLYKPSLALQVFLESRTPE